MDRQDSRVADDLTSYRILSACSVVVHLNLQRSIDSGDVSDEVTVIHDVVNLAKQYFNSVILEMNLKNVLSSVYPGSCEWIESTSWPLVWENKAKTLGSLLMYYMIVIYKNIKQFTKKQFIHL